MPSGRLTDYSEKTLKKAQAYLADDSIRFPSITGLARLLKCSRETIYAWSKDPEKATFSDTVREITDKQQQMLIEGGLYNDMNPSIVKLMLSANHGISEKTKQEVSGPDGGPIETSNEITVKFEGLPGKE